MGKDERGMALPTAVFAVPPATLRILANATVAPITEERRAADVEAAALDAPANAAGLTSQNAGA